MHYYLCINLIQNPKRNRKNKQNMVFPAETQKPEHDDEKIWFPVTKIRSLRMPSATRFSVLRWVYGRRMSEL
jgi:hypothetical protein